MVRSTRMFFVGDSFVQGVGDPEHRGWVGRVLQASHVPGRDLTGFNLGVRRNTSSDVLARCWAEIARRTDPAAEHRLVVSVGSNDAVEEDGAPRVEPDRTLGNMTQLLAESSRRGMTALVVGPPPVMAGGRRHLDRLLELDRGFATLCAQADVPYVAVTKALAADELWRTEAASGDGAHPGAGGYERLAALVLAAGWHRWQAGPAPASEHAP